MTTARPCTTSPVDSSTANGLRSQRSRVAVRAMATLAWDFLAGGGIRP